MSRHDERPDDQSRGRYDQVIDHARKSHEMERMTLSEERVYQNRPEAGNIDDENYKGYDVKEEQK